MKKFLKGIILSIAVLSLIGAGAVPPPFPFVTYDDASKLQSGPAVPACANGGVVVQLGESWRVLSWPSRDLFIHFDANGAPDFAYLTVGTSGAINVKRVITVDEGRRLYPTGCEYGDEQDA